MAYVTTGQLLAEISDHWRKDPDSNIYKLLDGFNAPFEAVSDNSSIVKNWRDISLAKGTTLDLLGKDRKTYRVGQDDDFYKFLIYMKNLLAKSQGTNTSIANISKTALNANANIKIWQTGTRHIAVTIPISQAGTVEREKIILNSLQQLVALGIWLDKLIWQAETSSQNYYAAIITTNEHYELSTTV
ncbi:hypothetical protein J2Z60_001081 [Lactobacillus colini]|uniref:Uncharacterized protein n=1 Tax=Lactobacillus colini TaxID=1819254 RepID=A0ABS4MDZ0_9LACO|nr:hypothetical protein [Lactobacillus colini]MBP2057906.1 hypothetical protein [Lactobacillus colini]